MKFKNRLYIFFTTYIWFVFLFFFFGSLWFFILVKFVNLYIDKKGNQNQVVKTQKI